MFFLDLDHVPFFSSSPQVADARMKGDIGERERQSRAAQEVAHIEATIAEKQNANAQRVAHSEKDLAVVRAQCERERLLAEIDVSMATDKRKAELETEVDRARTAQQIAYLQSTQVRARRQGVRRQGVFESNEMLVLHGKSP